MVTLRLSIIRADAKQGFSALYSFQVAPTVSYIKLSSTAENAPTWKSLSHLVSLLRLASGRKLCSGSLQRGNPSSNITCVRLAPLTKCQTRGLTIEYYVVDADASLIGESISSAFVQKSVRRRHRSLMLRACNSVNDLVSLPLPG